MEKYYINPDNTYWGCVVDSDELPFEGATEVPNPPDSHASQVWNGQGWNPYVPQVPILTQLDNLFETLQPSDQLQYLPFLGGIYALIDQNQIPQAKGLLAAIPTTGSAQAVQQQMLGVLQ